jgi:hypothetical protein
MQRSVTSAVTLHRRSPFAANWPQAIKMKFHRGSYVAEFVLADFESSVPEGIKEAAVLVWCDLVSTTARCDA